ncbi:LysR family transcriptional regulator [Halotia wernerae UHCC 0503]|jgi:DNA-binding transcriptional LysR family regulator|nr:LysR family transcriptional regulator [Halotia wernerae UHCC 0503]
MSKPDLNLLAALDTLLAEGSVAKAASRLGLSPSAMSHTLARLREATGDKLLVRAGRGLVPTPRALELARDVGRLVRDGEAMLRPAGDFDLSKLDRVFTMRARDGFAESFGPALIARLRREAPRVRLHFVAKSDKESAPLRDGTIDLETGVVDAATSPELRARRLFRDRWIGVVRRGHALSRGKVTADRYAKSGHILVARRLREDGPVDIAARAKGLTRDIAVVVGNFSAALALTRETDLVASVPDRHTQTLRGDLHAFALPFPTKPIDVSLLWHPRLDADPAHRWLRDCVFEAVKEPPSPS